MAQTGAREVSAPIVEDEPAILRLLSRALGRRGLTVMTARRGDEAVGLYRSHQDEIDLVLLDVQMSPMDGPQTLAELRRINPYIRAAFMSGSAEPYTPSDLVALGAHVFAKPFPSATNLAHALKEVAMLS